MNKVFRVIWNASTQSWSVVSELARGRVKSSSNNQGAEVALAIPMALALSVMALPIDVQAAAALDGATSNSKTVHIETDGADGTAANNILIGQGATAGRVTTSIIPGVSGNRPSQDYQSNYAHTNIVIGNATSASKLSIVIGDGAKAWGSQGLGYDQIAIGTKAEAAGLNSIAFGKEAYTTSVDGISIGRNAASNGERAVVVGAESASAARGVSIGYQSNASFQSSVAIGEGSKTNEAATQEGKIVVNGVGYGDATGIVPNGSTTKSYVFSVGSDSIKRQIKNVAPGKISADSTDAINGSQLFQITKGIQENTRTYFHVNSKETKNFDAPNKNAQATGANAMAVGPNASSAGAGGLAIGVDSNVTNSAGIAIGIQALASADAATALGQGAVASGLNSIAIGLNSKATHANSVALGRESETGAIGTNNDYIIKNDSQGNTNMPAFAGIAKDQSGSISVGKAGAERQIHNVAAGRITATSTDAVNGSQLYHVANNTGFNIQQNGTAKSRINNNGEVNFINGTYSTAVVADGENSSSVKFDIVTQNIDSNSTTGVASPNGNTEGLTTAKTVSDAINKAVEKAGWTVKANNDTGERINNNGAVSFNNGSNILVERSANNITIKTVQNPTFNDGATIGGMLSAKGGLTVAAGQTVNMGGNQIQNVANGTRSQDAVNVSQLNTVRNNTIKLDGNSGSTNTQQLDKSGGLSFGVKGTGMITSTASGSDVTLDLTDDTKNKINNAATKNLDNLTDAGNTVIKNQAKQAINVISGDNTTVTTTEPNGVKTFKVDVDLSGYTRTDALESTAKIRYKANNSASKQATLDTGLTFKNKGNLEITAEDNGVINFSLDKTTQADIAKKETVVAGNGVTVTNGTNSTGGQEFTVAVNDGHIKDKAKEAIEVVGEGLATVTPSTKGDKQIYTVGVSEQGVKNLAKNAVNITSNDITVTSDNTDPNTKTFTLALQKSTTVTAGENKVVTSGAVYTAINEAGWNLKANSETAGRKISNTNDVIFQEGKNINITREDNKIIVKTVDSPTFTTLETTGKATLGGLTMKSKASVNMGNNQVKNVANGTDNNDAVNVSQLNALGTNTFKLSGDNASETDTQALNKQGGLNFGVKGQAGYIVTKASGTDVSLSLADNVKNKLDNLADNPNAVYANQSLSNINQAGIQKIKDQVGIQDGLNTKGSFSEVNGVKTFKVDVDLASAPLAYKADGETSAKSTALSTGLTFKNTDGLAIASKDGGVVEFGLDKATKDAIAIRETVVGGNGVTVTEDPNNSTGGKQFRVAVQDDHIKRQAKQAVEVVSGSPNDLTVTPDNKDLKDTYTLTLQKSNTVTAGDTKVVTSDAVHNAIDRSGWVLKANDEKGEGKKITNNQEAVFNEGKNINVTRDGNKIIIKTIDTPTFSGLDAGGKITNVTAGTAATDAVNKSQLDAVSNNTTNNAAEIAKGLNIAAGKTGTGTNTENTGESKLVLGDTLTLSAGDNMDVSRNGKNFTISTSKTPTFTSVKTDTINVVNDANIGGMLNANGGLTVANGKTIDMGGNRITKVASGEKDDDAVNLSQLNATKAEMNKGWNITTSKSAGGNVSGTTTEQINMGELVTVDAGKNINITQSANKISVAVNDNPTFNKVTATHIDTTTLNTTGVVNVGGMLNANGGLTVAKNQTVNMGGNRVTKVADGEQDDDAVNLSQLNATKNALTDAGLKFNGNTGEAFTLRKLGSTLNISGEATTAGDYSGKNVKTVISDGKVAIQIAENPTFNDLTATGNTTLGGNGKTFTVNNGTTINMGNNVVSNVKAGEKDTDATNLKQVKDLVANSSWNLTNGAVDGGVDETDKNLDKEAINPNDQLKLQAGKNIKVKREANGTVTYSTQDNVTFTNVSATDINTATLTTSGAATIGGMLNANGGLTVAKNQTIDMGGNRVTKVADGEKDDDAVNLSQLNKVKNALTDAGLNFNGNAGDAFTLRKLGSTLNISGEATTAGDYSGKNVKTVISDGKVAIQIAENPTFNDLTATGNTTLGGAGKTFTVNNGTTINMGNNVVSGVKAGEKDTDATNLKQVKDLVANSSWNLTNGAVDGGVDETDKNLDKEAINPNDQLKLQAGKNIKVKREANGTVTYSTQDNVTFTNVSATHINTATLTTSGVATIGGMLNANGGLTVAENTSVNMGGNRVQNVANGTEDKDAVNLSQLKEATSNLTSKGLDFSGNEGAATHRNLGQTLAIQGSATTAGNYSSKNVKTVVTEGKVEIQIAENPTFNDITATGNSTFGGAGKTFTINNGTTVNMGNNVVSGVANGDISANSTQAVNGSQLHAVKQLIGGGTNTNVTIVNPDGSTTNATIPQSNGYTLTTYNVENQKEYRTNNVIEAIGRMNEQGIKFFHTNDGIVKPKVQGENTIDSSASGKYATAIGYQATASGENAIALGKGAKASGANTISIGVGNQVTGNNSGAIGDPSTISGNNSYSLGNNNTVATNNTFVVGNNVTATADNSVFLGANTGYVADNGKTTKGTAAHTEQTIEGQTYKYAGGKADEVVGVVSVGNVKADGSMETRRIQNVAPGLIGEDSTDAINGSQLYALSSVVNQGWSLDTGVAAGTNGVAHNSQSTPVQMGKTVVVNAGQNMVVTQDGRNLTLATSMAPNFNSLSINPNGKVDMGGNRVQNVGKAVNAGDAVNYGQFKAELGKMDRDLRAGIAGAMASGMLLQSTRPGESIVSVSGTTYRGTTGVALGYSRTSDNGKIVIKLAGMSNSAGDFGAGAAIGYKW